MRLAIADTVIADSAADAVVKEVFCESPTLELRNERVDVIGSRWARNIKRAYGLVLKLEVHVVRSFQTRALAAEFEIEELSRLAAGLSGRLKYTGRIGVEHVYDNAVLDSVDVVRGIGVSNEIVYAITCGAPLSLKDFILEVAGYAVEVNGNIVTITDYERKH